MKYLLFTCATFAALFFAYISGPKFGSVPKGRRLLRMKMSKNYRNGQFRNIGEDDGNLPNGMLGMWQKFFAVIFKVIANQKNIARDVPSAKTDLASFGMSENVIVWFGHSSYFMQLDGKRFAVDPVMSEISSPIPFCPRAFRGTNVYSPGDIPPLDYLIISHDHWDHLDYSTVLRLNVRRIICPLGVGAHFERWGFRGDDTLEMDWNESVKLPDGLIVDCLPAKHFSGRGFLGNRSLWASFMVTTPNVRIYIGGDGGYGKHFREIGNAFGGIDLAILENGQYGEKWRNMHMFPEDTARAAEDLGAKALLPVHNSKFALSTHKWNEPRDRLMEICRNKNFKLLTPIIGERIDLETQMHSTAFSSRHKTPLP
ncbi:MAG: MBL fold metallo-hydrolase [Puniceicoccales bacterium]|nr:MBL fold metallo-hydrolase [Puniceicoccales bacterium]